MVAHAIATKGRISKYINLTTNCNFEAKFISASDIVAISPDAYTCETRSKIPKRSHMYQHIRNTNKHIPHLSNHLFIYLDVIKLFTLSIREQVYEAKKEHIAINGYVHYCKK
jgi:hypothetical protein